MNITPLSQRNSQWSRKILGFSNKTIGTQGCTLTCLTMLLNHYGYSETPDTVNANLKSLGEYSKKNPYGAFQGALLVWQNVFRKYPRVKFIKRVRNYSNAEVSFQVYVKNNPVLVEVYAGKIGAPIHWVLFIGNRKCNDPWFGKELSTGYYTPQTGYSLYERSNDSN